MSDQERCFAKAGSYPPSPTRSPKAERVSRVVGSETSVVTRTRRIGKTGMRTTFPPVMVGLSFELRIFWQKPFSGLSAGFQQLVWSSLPALSMFLISNFSDRCVKYLMYSRRLLIKLPCPYPCFLAFYGTPGFPFQLEAIAASGIWLVQRKSPYYRSPKNEAAELYINRISVNFRVLSSKLADAVASEAEIALQHLPHHLPPHSTQLSPLELLSYLFFLAE
ncbi:uncharacterized protein BDR25DRAFT_363443 [Lindgomyces ingoldianus]|uniref:Uncharacterized protein n=1 Tax=Lindgomyces ingoldianus TaxID=673940 RepID=A0ACB6Q8E4_9PLEO|nr:uncharacterized protein BDR25DRAFT_363443 [Lindgomyces ingoldianus]KAF2462863.1 hypothetical protein BDR25DRAFT_363443 [Lindgomyces ingoldianus]